jgi:hypothetical protein
MAPNNLSVRFSKAWECAAEAAMNARRGFGTSDAITLWRGNARRIDCQTPVRAVSAQGSGAKPKTRGGRKGEECTNEWSYL